MLNNFIFALILVLSKQSTAILRLYNIICREACQSAWTRIQLAYRMVFLYEGLAVCDITMPLLDYSRNEIMSVMMTMILYTTWMNCLIFKNSSVGRHIKHRVPALFKSKPQFAFPRAAFLQLSYTLEEKATLLVQKHHLR